MKQKIIKKRIPKYVNLNNSKLWTSNWSLSGKKEWLNCWSIIFTEYHIFNPRRMSILSNSFIFSYLFGINSLDREKTGWIY